MRSLGASASWTPWNLPDDIKEMIGRGTNLQPAMQQIANLAVEEIRNRLTSGAGDWPAIAASTVKRRRYAHSSGKRGGSKLTQRTQYSGSEFGSRGFLKNLQPFWGVRNAGWKITSPHAHLFALGTDQYQSSGGSRVARWSWREKKSHTVTKGKTRGKQTNVRRRSRSEASAFMRRGNTSSQHSPSRFFEYFSDALKARAVEIVSIHVLGISTKAA